MSTNKQEKIAETVFGGSKTDIISHINAVILVKYETVK
jgi:hypothetical protein